MNLLRRTIRRLLNPIEPLPSGLYAYKAPRTAPLPYRLHLRLEPDGRGVLLINASIVLHLNPTAAEFAYHLIQGTSVDEVASQIARRYRVSREQAAHDYRQFLERVEAIYLNPNSEPVSFLDFDQQSPRSVQLSAPYRLDCALTHRSESQGFSGDAAPDELSTSDWQAILDTAWSAGIPHVIFTGGEPTLRLDLAALIGYAEHLGMVTGLVSNGLRLADSAYLDQLLEAGLDHVLIILRPDEERSWEALTSLIYWTDVLESRLHIAAHLTLTPDNQSHFPHWLERLAASGLHALSLTASQPDLASHLLRTRDTSASLDLTLIWNMPVPHAELNPFNLEMNDEENDFGEKRAFLFVEPDGRARLTFGDGRILGNLLRDPWEVIWGLGS